MAWRLPQFQVRFQSLKEFTKGTAVVVIEPLWLWPLDWSRWISWVLLFFTEIEAIDVIPFLQSAGLWFLSLWAFQSQWGAFHLEMRPYYISYTPQWPCLFYAGMLKWWISDIEFASWITTCLLIWSLFHENGHFLNETLPFIVCHAGSRQTSNQRDQCGHNLMWFA